MEIKAPNIITPNGKQSVFLAGTIEMGKSDDHQSKTCKSLENKLGHEHINVLNPRREFWKEGWKQSFDDANFYQQVNWELDAMEKADIIFVNILPDSKSPITLFEFGLYAKSNKLIMCCPKEFYRSGNVHIVCHRYHVPLFEKYENAVDYLINKLILLKKIN